MTKSENLNCSYACPIEAAVAVIGGKWKSLILYHLLKGDVLRFSALHRLIPSINQRMLAHQLRELERDGLVQRKVYPIVPPKVEYRLTRLGTSLAPMLEGLRDWGEKYMGRPR